MMELGHSNGNCSYYILTLGVAQTPQYAAFLSQSDKNPIYSHFKMIYIFHFGQYFTILTQKNKQMDIQECVCAFRWKKEKGVKL